MSLPVPEIATDEQTTGSRTDDPLPVVFAEKAENGSQQPLDRADFPDS